jgi:hypothetical protein
MSKKYEIIPPSRREVAVRRENAVAVVSPPRINPGGIVSSALTRWEANRHTRTIGAVAARTRAEADLFDAQAQAVEAYVRRQRAGYRLQELPEILETDRRRRRGERAEELRELQHRHEVAEVHRATELAHVESVLVDAQQALKAQREYGYLNYELAWKKKACELLDVELSAAERRAMLRQHIAELEASRSAEAPALGPDASDDEIADALYERRAQLNASGLDTSRIDAVIESRKVRR